MCKTNIMYSGIVYNFQSDSTLKVNDCGITSHGITQNMYTQYHLPSECPSFFPSSLPSTSKVEDGIFEEQNLFPTSGECSNSYIETAAATQLLQHNHG